MDDVLGGIGLDILEPGNVALEGLEVFIRPLFAFLFIAEVGINGGFEDFIFAIADCDLVILIEHDAENPVAAGAGVKLSFLFIKGEGGVHLGEKLDDQALHCVIIEDNFAGNLDIVRVTGVAETVGDGGAIRVMLAGFKMIDGLGEGMVKGDHHDVGDERGNGGTLRQCAVKEAEIKRFEQLCVAGGAGEDEVKGVDEFKLGDDEIRRGGGEEAVEIEVGKPPGIEALVTLGGGENAAVLDIGESAGVVVGEHPGLEEGFEVLEGFHQVGVGGIDPAKAAGGFGDREMVVQAGTGVGEAKRFILLVERLELENHLFHLGDAHDAGRDFVADDGTGCTVTAGGKVGEVEIPAEKFFKRHFPETFRAVIGNVNHMGCSLCEGYVCVLMGDGLTAAAARYVA